MAYTKTVWENGNAPSINADNLNKIEDGIADAHNISLIPGPPGPAGENGLDGANGVDGAPGAPGLPGANGIDGANGINGDPGPQGPAGANGNNGLSAYEIALNNGFNGNSVEWLDSLVGPQGPAGANGAAGANGSNGVDGANGVDGSNGTNGVDGRTVLSGANNPGDINGVNGDFWISTNNTTIWGPKANNSWNDTGPVALVGPAGANGANGENGAPGENGANGTDGVGVASGGNTGQYLAKSSNNNYETTWSTLPSIPVLNVFTCKQTSAVTGNNNVTAYNVAGMALNVSSGRTYHFKFITSFSSTVNTCGIGFYFAAPTMTTSFFKVELQQAAAGTDMFYTNSATSNMATILKSASVAATNTNYYGTIEGVCTPSNNGSLQLTMSPEVNNNVTVNNGGMGYMIDAG